jgi:hypothetical protein
LGKIIVPSSFAVVVAVGHCHHRNPASAVVAAYTYCPSTFAVVAVLVAVVSNEAKERLAYPKM